MFSIFKFLENALAQHNESFILDYLSVKNFRYYKLPKFQKEAITLGFLNLFLKHI